MTTRSEDNQFGNEFLEQILDWIIANIRLEDRATTAELDYWAEQNGYVLE